MAALYLETSAALRVVLEAGTTPELEERVRAATVLVTSRLSLVESGRALIRVRLRELLNETRIEEVREQLSALWDRCQIRELSTEVCDCAADLSPDRPLRSLDALHAATFLLEQRQMAGIELVTEDDRLRAAFN